MIYWFIGQPGCGKTTLAKMWADFMRHMCVSTLHLDGDELRKIFGGQYKQEHFNKEYRDSNTVKLQNFVEYVDKQGVNVVVSTVNPTRSVREDFKARYKDIIEIYIENTGDHPRKEFAAKDFEKPLTNFIDFDTNGLTPEQSFYALKVLLIDNFIHKRNL